MNVALAKKLNELARLSRWPEYSTTKLSLLFTPLITIFFSKPDLAIHSAYFDFLAFVLFGSLYLAFGYMVNDFADQEVDRAAGKPNFLRQYTKSGALFLLVILGVGGISLVLAISTQLSVLLALISAYLLAITYSCPPIHFKVRGFWGLLVGGLAQRTMPVLIVYSFYQKWDGVTCIILALYSLIGVRWMLIHQIIDEKNDLRTGVQTFAVKKGRSVTTLWLERIVFPVEVLLGSAFILVVANKIPLSLFLIFPYWGELVARLVLQKQGKVKFSLTQYGDIPLATSYFLIWPIWLALLLGIKWLSLIGIFVLILAWQYGYMRGEGIRLYRLISLLWWRK